MSKWFQFRCYVFASQNRRIFFFIWHVLFQKKKQQNEQNRISTVLRSVYMNACYISFLKIYSLENGIYIWLETWLFESIPLFISCALFPFQWSSYFCVFFFLPFFHVIPKNMRYSNIEICLHIQIAKSFRAMINHSNSQSASIQNSSKFFFYFFLFISSVQIYNTFMVCVCV